MEDKVKVGISSATGITGVYESASGVEKQEGPSASTSEGSGTGGYTISAPGGTWSTPRPR